MPQKILFSGVLVHQDNDDQVIDLIVDLYEDRLVAYLDQKKTSIFGVIGLMNSVKLEFTDIENTDEDEIQFLFFQNKSRFAVLFCELPTDFDKWIKFLKPLCVLANFSQFYTFEKLIGKGTFAKVVMCSRNADKKKFAVKVFDKTILKKAKDSTQQISAIQNEVNIMRQINHPNIIKMHEVYEGGKHVYIVLELLSGGELFKRIYNEENFSENIVISLMRNLLQALEYLHAKKIMHRDIKPENLIIRDKTGSMGDIILADFGLSEYTGKKEFLFKRCGTPGYVAPEILANEPYNTEVDVFSAGVIMYILLTGASPFFGESYMEILNKNKNGIIDFDFKAMGCKLSTNSINLMKMMLKKNPKERITIQEALKHPWFKEKGESLLTKIHYQTMDKLLQQQKQLIKTTKPSNINESQNLITNSPIINGSLHSLQNSAKSSPNSNSMTSPSSLISPYLEKKSKFAGMKQK